MINQFINSIKTELKKVIVGQDEVILHIILSFLSGGHVILEGVPGLAKTFIARSFAKITGVDFNRIQFTPDLMPADILGTMIFNINKNEFKFNKGPIFTNILLADEINRTSPKTQAALLEVMQENQVTIEGTKHVINAPFMVIATQNPIEFEGTYPLPEAQLDRFTMKIIVDYPDSEIELDVLKKFNEGFDSKKLDEVTFNPINIEELAECRKEFETITLEDNILTYILNIVRATRKHSTILHGVSTRAAIYLLNLAKYHAAYDDRNYVIPDDIKQIALPVLRHRIIMQADAEIEGYKNDDIILEIIENEKVPR